MSTPTPVPVFSARRYRYTLRGHCRLLTIATHVPGIKYQVVFYTQLKKNVSPATSIIESSSLYIHTRVLRIRIHGFLLLDLCDYITSLL